MTDVTAAKQAEAKIRQSEQELRQFLDLTPQHIAALGPDSQPVDIVNPERRQKFVRNHLGSVLWPNWNPRA